MLIRQAIESVNLFYQVSDSSIDVIRHGIKKHLFKKGTLLIDHFCTKNTFLYVVSGLAKLFKETSEGDEVILDVLSHSQYCGEQFLFQDKDKEDAYAIQALSDLEVLALPLPILRKLVVDDHQMSLNFLQSTLQKQKSLSLEIEHLSSQNAIQRLGCFILKLCDLSDKKSISLKLPYDKAILASRLGMRAETFSRTLHKLSEKCDLRIKGDRLYIDSVEKSSHACPHCSSPYLCHQPEIRSIT